MVLIVPFNLSKCFNLLLRVSFFQGRANQCAARPVEPEGKPGQPVRQTAAMRQEEYLRHRRYGTTVNS